MAPLPSSPVSNSTASERSALPSEEDSDSSLTTPRPGPSDPSQRTLANLSRPSVPSFFSPPQPDGQPRRPATYSNNTPRSWNAILADFGSNQHTEEDDEEDENVPALTHASSSNVAEKSRSTRESGTSVNWASIPAPKLPDRQPSYRLASSSGKARAVDEEESSADEGAQAPVTSYKSHLRTGSGTPSTFLASLSLGEDEWDAYDGEGEDDGGAEGSRQRRGPAAWRKGKNAAG